MPELPEVETSRVILAQDLTAVPIIAIKVGLPKLLRDSTIPTLDSLVGRSILAVRRRAKILIIDFTGDQSLLVHFKLSGQLMVLLPDGTRHVAGHPVPDPAGPYPHRATHVQFVFADGSIAYFSDIRQFGWFRLMPTSDVDAVIEAFGFGPEGVGPNAVTAAQLEEGLKRRSIPIKTAILDQSLVAGVGNIYADEALFHARINPLTPANALSRRKVRDLREGIVWSLEQGIAQGGATIVHQKATQFDGFPAVHGREGEPCNRCGRPIAKIRVGSRGTYYCPSCQRKQPAT